VEGEVDVRSSDRSLDGKIAALLGASTFAVYLAFPEHVYFFDGVLFAGFVKVTLGLGHDFRLLFDFPKHYLYLPTIYVIAWVLERALPGPIEIYRVMQLLASALSACTNAAAYLVFRRFGAGRVACAAAALLWAFTRTHWERALEGQVYPVGYFFALSTLLLASATPWPIRPRRLAALSALTALAVLFHVSNVLVVIPVAGAWLIWHRRAAIAPSALYAFGAALLAGTVPVIQYRLYDAAEVRRWFLFSTNSTEHFDSGFLSLQSLPTFHSGGLTTFSRSLVAIEGPDPAAMLGRLALAGMILLLGASVWGIVRDGSRTRAAASVWAIAFAVYGLFFVVAAPGYVHFWEVQSAAVVALIALGLPAPPALRTTALLATVAATTFAVNLVERVVPISRATFNRAADEATRIGRLTPPDGRVLVAGGMAGDNDLKAYALYFAERGWLSFDMQLASLPPRERCAAIRDTLAASVARHGVLFASSRVVAPDGIGRTFRDLGCSADDAARALAGHICILVESGDPFGLLLLFDDPARPELAAARRHLRAIGRPDLALRTEVPTARFPCDRELWPSGS
jgi:hypothetical protein